MLVLLFSDSHGNYADMAKIISQYSNIDLIIHLGDYYKDGIKLVEMFPKIRFELIKGNNDFNVFTDDENILLLENKKIFISHGHIYGVKNSYKKIIEKGISINADAVFFGHTHLAYESYYENILILNPGSIGKPILSEKQTYYEIYISKDKIITKFKKI